MASRLNEYVKGLFQPRVIRPVDKGHLIMVGSLGARVVPVTGRRGKAFWIRVGRVKRGTHPVELTHGIYAEDLLHLPQIACRIASYLSKQALLDPQVRRELTSFVSRWVDAKWDNTYPELVTQWHRHVCGRLARH